MKDNEKNKTCVTYLWGDQEPCFYYACKLAQEEHVHNGYRVFKAPFTRDDFLDGYKGEECLLLLGLGIRDIVPASFNALLDGWDCRDENLSNVKHIIITAHCAPVDFECYIFDDGDEQEYRYFLNAIDHEYEIRNTEIEWEASVDLVIRNQNNATIATKEYVELFHLLDTPPIAQTDYFERFDFYSYLRDSGERADTFIQNAGQLPVHEQRKLCAALEMTDYGKHDVVHAEMILEDLDSYSFYPDILNRKDFGYYAVYERNLFCVSSQMMPYFDFEHLGYDMLFRPEGTEGISKFGYIIHHYTGKKLQRTISVTEEAESKHPIIESNNDMTMLFEDDFELPF